MHFHHLSAGSMRSSIIRTVIFTLGHYCIDTSVTHFVTGATWGLAMTSSILGPILNAVWYFTLDKIFFCFLAKKIRK